MGADPLAAPPPAERFAARLRVVVSACRTLGPVLLRRLRGRRARPGWSWLFEWFCAVLKREGARMARLPVVERRAYQAALADLGAASRITPCARVDLGGLPALRFHPPGADLSGPALLYLHGGAYLTGSPRTHADLAARLARASGLPTWVPAYRLAPEHPFPAAPDDVRRAWRALRAEAPHRPIVVAGDSAGASLALGLAVELRDAGLPGPAALGLLSPWADLAARGGSIRAHARYDWAEPADFIAWAEAYLQGADPAQPRASPLRAELHDLPPTRIEAGGAEMAWDQAVELTRRLAAAGVAVEFVPWPDMVHAGWLFAPLLPEPRRRTEAVGRRLGELARAAGSVDQDAAAPRPVGRASGRPSA